MVLNASYKYVSLHILIEPKRRRVFFLFDKLLKPECERLSAKNFFLYFKRVFSNRNIRIVFKKLLF